MTVDLVTLPVSSSESRRRLTPRAVIPSTPRGTTSGPFPSLYPVVRGPADPWRIPVGISAAHVFRGTLDRAFVEWPALFEELSAMLDFDIDWFDVMDS